MRSVPLPSVFPFHPSPFRSTQRTQRIHLPSQVTKKKREKKDRPLTSPPHKSNPTLPPPPPIILPPPLPRSTPSLPRTPLLPHANRKLLIPHLTSIPPPRPPPLPLPNNPPTSPRPHHASTRPKRTHLPPTRLASSAHDLQSW